MSNTINLFNDPILGNNPAIDPLSPQALQAKRDYLARIQALAQESNQVVAVANQNPIWDKIDEELSGLTDMQKSELMRNGEYQEAQENVNNLLQGVFLQMMKPRVENSQQGKDALEKQLSIVKKLKKDVIEQTNKELEEYRKWKESQNQSKSK